ncbi:hypothetical protein HNY73_013112 [Argiope bruennichi]|uniref:Uncharacterized protein n=1 Tax=Argiope bruennichi TaxID=94029 RepID=A0A8T0F1T5_ARGBR|nr:hypothetical protein HNY73_013112 [Argiope bruennichi]
MKSIILLLFIGISIVTAMHCPENFCLNSSCQKRTCGPDEKLYRNGNCDCCGKCIQLKKEGSPCKVHEVLNFRMAPADMKFMNSDCDEGLSCKFNKCTKD